MGITNFPHGVSSFGIPQLGGGSFTTTGNIFFVQNTDGSDGNEGTDKSCPFKTLDYAIGKCTASNGDIIILMTGHAETTTAIALDQAGISIIGLGVGRTRPTFTATTAATDLIDVTAASCKIENVRLVGAASGCTSLISLVGAADFQAIGCSFEHGAAPTTAISVGATSPRFSFISCNFLGSANGPAVAIDIVATGDDDFIVRDCIFNYGRYGLDTAGIRANADAADGGLIEKCLFIGMDTAAIDFNSSDTANIAGLIVDCSIGMGADTANIDTAVDMASYGLIRTYCTDLPAEGAGHIPVTTPA
jgi:hypothetical protein